MHPTTFSFEQHLSYCFHKPCQPNDLPVDLHNPELRPILHLLRRDLEGLYGAESETYSHDSMKPPFILLLGMLCGFDLLSSMYYGEESVSADYRRAQELLDRNGFSIHLHESGKKFRLFLTKVAHLDEQEAAFLLVLRNSVVHTYSLNLDKKKYRDNSIVIDPPIDQLLKIEQLGNKKKYILNLWELKKRFLESIINLQDLLRDSLPGSEERRILMNPVT